MPMSKSLFVGDQEQYNQALEIRHQCPQLLKNCGHERTNSTDWKAPFPAIGTI